MLFTDRLEVWNPGELPPSLTPELLRQPHPSIPRNPLIAEPLYLARYIEKAGSGTLEMIERCNTAHLPEPDFEQRAGQWVVTLWRDWLTDEAIASLGLNQRQQKAVIYLKTHGRINNNQYRTLTGVSDRTVLREFSELLARGIIEKVGVTGRGTYYVLRRETRQKPAKPDTIPPDGTTRHKPDKGDRL